MASRIKPHVAEHKTEVKLPPAAESKEDTFAEAIPPVGPLHPNVPPGKGELIAVGKANQQYFVARRSATDASVIEIEMTAKSGLHFQPPALKLKMQPTPAELPEKIGGDDHWEPENTVPIKVNLEGVETVVHIRWNQFVLQLKRMSDKVWSSDEFASRFERTKSILELDPRKPETADEISHFLFGSVAEYAHEVSKREEMNEAAANALVALGGEKQHFFSAVETSGEITLINADPAFDEWGPAEFAALRRGFTLKLLPKPAELPRQIGGEPPYAPGRPVPLHVRVDGQEKTVWVSLDEFMKSMLHERREIQSEESQKLAGQRDRALLGLDLHNVDAPTYITRFIEGSIAELQALQLKAYKEAYANAIRSKPDPRAERDRAQAIHDRCMAPYVWTVPMDINDITREIAALTPEEIQQRTKTDAVRDARCAHSTTIKKDSAEGKWARAKFEETDAWVQKEAASRKTMRADDIEKLLFRMHENLARDQENNGGKAGELRTIPITAGGFFQYVDPSLVSSEFKKWAQWCETQFAALDAAHDLPATKRAELAIEFAARANQWLISIHPFSDGNGRACRMFVDFILLRQGLPPASISEGVAVFSIFSSENSSLAIRAVIKGIRKVLQAGQTGPLG